MKGKRNGKNHELFRALQEINHRIDAANSLFNTTTDELLLEAAIYELKYLRLHHAHLLRLAREEAIRAESAASVPARQPTPVPINT